MLHMRPAYPLQVQLRQLELGKEEGVQQVRLAEVYVSRGHGAFEVQLCVALHVNRAKVDHSAVSIARPYCLEVLAWSQFRMMFGNCLWLTGRGAARPSVVGHQLLDLATLLFLLVIVWLYLVG